MAIYCMVGCGCAVTFQGHKFGATLVITAMCLISLVPFEYFHSVYPYLQSQYQTNALIPFGITLLGLYILINIAFNYIVCIRTSAKFVHITDEKDKISDDELRKSFYIFDPDLNYNESIRYCEKCKAYKPWRTHHCSKCNECIYKMDHHCPYVWRCVGYGNYRYFVMFLFYLWCGTLFFMIVGHGVFNQLYQLRGCSIASVFIECYVESRGSDENMLFLFCYLLCWSVFIVISFFLWMHLYLLCTNQSTVEMANVRIKAMTRKNANKYTGIKYVYSLNSVIENIQQVFGKKWYLAFLPIITYPLGNGKVFALRKEVHDIVFGDRFAPNTTEIQNLLV